MMYVGVTENRDFWLFTAGCPTAVVRKEKGSTCEDKLSRSQRVRFSHADLCCCS